MDNKQEQALQIMITSGPKELEKAVVGFAFAASAAISDISVLTVLTGEAIAWIDDNEPTAKKKSGGFESVRDYIEILVSQDCRICLCSACSESHNDHHQISGTILPNVCYTGLTEIAINTGQNLAQTIVF